MPMPLIWSQDLYVGYEIIDNQHKELFARVNRLVDAMSKGEGKHEVEKVVNFLGEYVISHFKAEEEFMQKYRYPGYSSHKILHSQLIRTYTDLKVKINYDGVSPTMTIQVQRQLGDWLINHIGKQDKAFGAYLKNEGYGGSNQLGSYANWEKPGI
jgi:hemerythrin